MDRNRIIKALSSLKIKAEGARTEFVVAKELGRGGNGAAFVVKSPKRELVAKFYVPPDSRDLDQNALKRFQREMQLTTTINHPYVVRSEGTGTVHVGSYQIPFYLMRRATGTMREMVPASFALPDLGKLLRTFTRVLQGVSCLHHLGIVHRDLKPENVLLFDGVPRIADLGIAHVAPGFMNWSQLTVPKEQLMNRDYYAPEQRHGDATKVDHRADIYALGCMLYEFVSGISPTRPNLPPLEEFHRALAFLDKVLARMMAHRPDSRYQTIDAAICAYRLLAEIADDSSIPYLAAGLYPRHTAKKPQFTTSEYAAKALRNYSSEVRLRVLESLNDQVRADDIAIMIDHLEPSEVYPRLLRLYREKQFYREWREPAGLPLLLKIDEDKSWPIVEGLMTDRDELYCFLAFRDIYPFVNSQRQQEIISHYLDRRRSLSAFELPTILDSAMRANFAKDYLVTVFDRVRDAAQVVFKQYSAREDFVRKLELARSQAGL